MNPEPLTPTRFSTPSPTIRTRAQLDVLLENIAALQRERDRLHRAQESELAAVRQRYRTPLSELEEYLEAETSWAEGWAQANPEAFDASHSLAAEHATLHFSPEAPHLERASRRWTWTRIAVTLAGLAWGRRYLRLPAPEVDKDALLADVARLSPEDLRNAGLRVVRGGHYVVTPHAETSTAWPVAA